MDIVNSEDRLWDKPLDTMPLELAEARATDAYELVAPMVNDPNHIFAMPERLTRRLRDLAWVLSKYYKGVEPGPDVARWLIGIAYKIEDRAGLKHP